MRSKKVSNYNLYRIGIKHRIAGKMNALIFDPFVNWLPPCYTVGKGRRDDINLDDISDDDSYDSDVEIGRKIIRTGRDKLFTSWCFRCVEGTTKSKFKE